MKVIRKKPNNECTLGTLNQGDNFEYSESIYLVTSQRNFANTKRTIVNLETGLLLSDIDTDLVVKRIELETIEK